MKKILPFYLIAIFIFSCTEDKSDVFSCEDFKTEDEFIIKVKENKIQCTGYEGQTECYLVQRCSKINTEEWEYFYEQIEGFTYEPGFVYELLVAKESIKNPPMDMPSVKYSLRRELSKKPQ